MCIRDRVRLLISDCQPGDFNMTSEYIFAHIEVDNNDPPSVRFIDVPQPLSVQKESIPLSWEGFDPEGSKVFYALYYKPLGIDGWIPVSGATKLETTSFIWDVSELENGEYELKIVATEDSRDKLSTEIITAPFEINNPVEEEDDEKDDDGGLKDPGTDGDEGSRTMIFVLLAVVVVLAAVLVVAGILIIKKKEDARKIPPPGGFYPMPPPGNLPGHAPPEQISGDRSPGKASLPPAAPQEIEDTGP